MGVSPTHSLMRTNKKMITGIAPVQIWQAWGHSSRSWCGRRMRARHHRTLRLQGGRAGSMVGAKGHLWSKSIFVRSGILPLHSRRPSNRVILVGGELKRQPCTFPSIGVAANELQAFNLGQ